MTLSKTDQERYERLSQLEEQPGGTGTGGESHRGEDAVEVGREILRAALGNEEQVQKALRGGRPNLDGKSATGGESPTIRFRVTHTRQHELELLKVQMKRQYTSDLVRDALDEYVAKHLHTSA